MREVAPFGPFLLERMLGRGGMAEAFLARRGVGPRTPLVVKRIRADYAHDPAFLKRLILEAQVASRLDHPNLVRFREFGRVGDCHYIVMDQVRGWSLHRVLQSSFEQGRRLEPEAALHIGTGLLDGLSAMHGVVDDDGQHRPMLHRDITPANVIIDTRGDPVIIDFGIAKDVNGPAITLPGQVIGTARYMAPEHRRAEFVDPRADVFSVSVVLFELFVGQHPWPPLPGMKELLRTTFDPPVLPKRLRKTLPRSVMKVIYRGLRCRYEDRFKDAEAMRQALFKVAPDASPAAARQSVLAFIDDLDLPLDEDLTTPVVNISPPRSASQEVMWSAEGEVRKKRSKPPEATWSSASILTIPPLPPRRDEGVCLAEAQAAALGRPRLRWMSVTALSLAFMVGAAAWYFDFLF